MQKTKQLFLHQCSSLTTTVSHITAVFRICQCFANKNKNYASHDCSASHHCRLVSSLFERRHAKNIFGSNMPQKKTRLHRPRPPFKLSTSGDVKKKTQSSTTCHASFLGKIMQHAGQKQKRLFGFGCSMRHAKLSNVLRGPFFQHELRPKWPLPVLCCTHRLLSS